MFRWILQLRPMGWERVEQLTSNSLKLVLGGLWRCLMATRLSQRRAQSQFEPLKAFDGYLMPTPNPTSTYKCVLTCVMTSEELLAILLWRSCCLGAVQPRVPCWRNSGAWFEGAGPCPDWRRWDSWRSKGNQSPLCRLWALGPQRTNHHHQHVVVWAVETGETRDEANE